MSYRVKLRERKYWCPVKLFYVPKIKVGFLAWNPTFFSLPLFLPQNLNNDEQRYTFYRTADVWPATFFA